MSNPPSSSSKEAPRLSVLDVLGIARRHDGDWARLRGLQYSTLSPVTALRAFSHGALALFTVYIYSASAPITWLLLWMLALILVHSHAWRLDRSLADVDQRRITPAEFYRQSISSVTSGLLWGSAILVFAPLGSMADLLALLMVVAVLAGGGIFFGTAVPLGTVLFTLITGSAAGLYLAFAELWTPLFAMVLLLICTLYGAIQMGRAYLEGCLTKAEIAEKEEVVSLLLREFEENEADWLWEMDPARRLRTVSPRFAFALGKTQAEAEGRPLIELLSGKNWNDGQFPPSLHELADRLKNRESFSNLIVEVEICGQARWWELSGTPMRDDKERFIGFRGVGSDVTEQRASDEKIAYLARFDTLTALPNRLQLTEALGEALRYASQWRSRCALLMVDLDRFKAVNDSLGHITGDKLLAQVSARLQALTNDNVICGRLGGDEFAVVIRDASGGDIVGDIARLVIETLSAPYQVDHHTLYVGASVGSAKGPRDGRSVEELMRNADLALYRAKDAGGGEHCQFEPQLHAFAEERRQLEVSLRKALDRDEMMLNFQPVVDARSESIMSFEALVRWNSAEHGAVSPAKFIPLAEDTRLIVPIGNWVLRKACMEARNWPAHVRVNVNVSPEQLLEPGFPEQVLEALKESDLAPPRLEVEVTESIFLRDASIAREALEAVMSLGCSVALDDFGTGYSSLGYLRKLRFSTIKVDRSFVQGAAQGSNESLAIINAVVAMAQNMGMTTTAEGVETAMEADLIRSLGCDKIQGYYFGRPMPSEDALRLFEPPTLRRA